MTRLPLARHTHTGHFGDLVIGGQRISIDQDPTGAFAELADVYCENSSAELPDSSSGKNLRRDLSNTDHLLMGHRLPRSQ